MRKIFFLLSTILAIFALMAFGYVNWNHSKEPNLVYNVDSRFEANITKENLHQAKSVADIVPREAEWNKVTFLNMKVAVLQDHGEITATGDNDVLNEDQIKLLRSLDYSTNFYLKGKGKRKGAGPEGLKDLDQEEFDFAYYITIIPEKEAEYIDGFDALISYLKEKSKDETAIIREDKLQPAQIRFTVSKNGTIGKVTLESTSGYPAVDEKLVKLVRNMPGEWKPASNSKGEKVDQELVFFFGRQGC